MSDWTPDKARTVYNVSHWSDGYFDINAKGELIVCPQADSTAAPVSLYDIAQACEQQGLAMPVLIRFMDILQSRVKCLHAAFCTAIEENDYQGTYTAVYPIKVNQQRSVVEQIVATEQVAVGLEAGSKPEFMAVLALARFPAGVIVCNGYKDAEYIRLALIATRLQHQVYIVIEKPFELDLVIEQARILGIRPILGVRVRLSSIGAGKWQNTGGSKSKFGLSATQLLETIERLREVELLDCLQLLHCHLGSQISNIRDIQRGVTEISRFYAELSRLGVPIQVLDVGGGLGVDYEGTTSRSFCSRNYSMQEYANNIVRTLQETCEEQQLAHPAIFTESGRALTAHHAVLITDVCDVECVPKHQDVVIDAGLEHRILSDMRDGLAQLSSRTALEVYHEMTYWIGEAHSLYNHGKFSLQQRAMAELLYFTACRKIHELLEGARRSHRELLDELNEKLADKYICNFSVFQSLPDVWAIQQVFPIVPLHRLNERPQRRGVIGDLTCDSDGRIDYYVDQDCIESTLPLHAIQAGQRYLLGFFLVGAYQEILGDMHNLFGDANSVDVSINHAGQFTLLHSAQGDGADRVLAYVNFETEDLLQAYQRKLAQTDLSDQQRALYLEQLHNGLHGYTYFEE